MNKRMPARDETLRAPSELHNLFIDVPQQASSNSDCCLGPPPIMLFRIVEIGTKWIGKGTKGEVRGKGGYRQR